MGQKSVSVGKFYGLGAKLCCREIRWRLLTTFMEISERVAQVESIKTDTCALLKHFQS